MVMTRGGNPDRNIRPGQAHPPQGNGQYSQIGNANAPMFSTSDKAAAIYGSSDAPDATRMSRMKNIADEALADASITASYGDPFVQGNDWTLTPNKTVDENGDLPSVPGFPGDTASDSEFSYLGQPPSAQGKVLKDPASVKAKPTVRNGGSPQFTGRYGA
jgi:hypothetical protein